MLSILFLSTFYMSAVTVKKVPVWKPIKVVYNDGTDHTVKLY